jgi:hypothetical protein
MAFRMQINKTLCKIFSFLNNILLQNAENIKAFNSQSRIFVGKVVRDVSQREAVAEMIKRHLFALHVPYILL